MQQMVAKIVFTLIAISSFSLYAHEEKEGAVKIVPVTDAITMFQAGGGNIAVSYGSEGVFIIDSDYAGSFEKINTALKTLTDQPARMLINTHWHFDHAGGNEMFGKHNTLIMAHENARKRMQKGAYFEDFDLTIAPAPAAALPVLTLTEDAKIHLNGEAADIISMAPGHTDGDIVIFWKESNVLHTGDLFFNGFWPYIDTASGGSLEGMIDATQQVLEMTNNETQIIPGHGPLASRKDLAAFHAMLTTVHARLALAKKEGKDAATWAAEEPLKDLEAEWGDGFLPTNTFIKILF